jgi:hypothetical protein
MLAGFQRRMDPRVLECLAAAGLSKLADNPQGLDLAHEEWDDVRELHTARTVPPVH